MVWFTKPVLGEFKEDLEFTLDEAVCSCKLTQDSNSSSIEKLVSLACLEHKFFHQAMHRPRT